MVIANVNFSEMIAARSGGVSFACLVDLMIASQDLPTMCFAMLSKQNISASAVPLVPIKANLYLKRYMKLLWLLLNQCFAKKQK